MRERIRIKSYDDEVDREGMTTGRRRGRRRMIETIKIGRARG